MQKPLTELERRVLDYLVEYLRSNTYQPSIREIGSQFTIKSTKTVSELLQSLADKGWIERDPSRSRGVRLLGFDMGADVVAVPVMDSIEAGNAPAVLHLDRRLVGGTGSFIVAMSGQHLVEHGIHNGDLLLIEPRDPANIEDGDIVWTRTAGGSAARRCTREADNLVLEPAGAEPVSTTLTPRQAAGVVLGCVTGVVRRVRPTAAHAPAIAQHAR